METLGEVPTILCQSPALLVQFLCLSSVFILQLLRLWSLSLPFSFLFPVPFVLTFSPSWVSGAGWGGLWGGAMYTVCLVLDLAVRPVTVQGRPCACESAWPQG